MTPIVIYQPLTGLVFMNTSPNPDGNVMQCQTLHHHTSSESTLPLATYVVLSLIKCCAFVSLAVKWIKVTWCEKKIMTAPNMVPEQAGWTEVVSGKCPCYPPLASLHVWGCWDLQIQDAHRTYPVLLWSVRRAKRVARKGLCKQPGSPHFLPTLPPTPPAQSARLS